MSSGDVTDPGHDGSVSVSLRVVIRPKKAIVLCAYIVSFGKMSHMTMYVESGCVSCEVSFLKRIF